MNENKKNLIDMAFKKGARSFIDLGGIWGIGGGYTFYTLDTYNVEKAYLIDTGITASDREAALKYPTLDMLQEDFGAFKNIRKLIKPVDVIFMFDILLHQANPDWSEVLAFYAEYCNTFIIFNPQYDAEKSIRFLDLGREGYIENVPNCNIGDLDRVLSHSNEIYDKYGKPWRDIHEIWQWGITNNDLISVLSNLGFSLKFNKKHEYWGLNVYGQSFSFEKEQKIELL